VSLNFFGNNFDMVTPPSLKGNEVRRHFSRFSHFDFVWSVNGIPA
jgi:hypothetical protein